MPALLLVANLLLITLAGSRPPWVLQELPPAGSTSTHVATIKAELDLTRGEKLIPAAIQLIVDGMDVTPQATITMTRDWPPSFVSITYTPSTLQPGTHRAEIHIRTEDDTTRHYTWTFVLTPP